MFLDEVGALPLQTQGMLLRFLEGGELRPVGSTRTIGADVRVIAATDRDLGEAIRRREFREDLYHRLSDVVLEVPPLRARREDIPLLVEHFRVRFNGKYDLSVEGVAPEGLRLMMTHGWPGNVRGLEKVLREAMLLREVGWVQPDALGIAGDAGPRQRGVAGETARVELSLLTRLGLLRPVGRGAATRYVPA